MTARPLATQPLTYDQRNVLWALRRDVEMHGAPAIPALSDTAAAINARRRKARESARGEAE